MSRPPLPEDGRARRRIEGKRRVQDVALDLFEQRGYAAVTVEEIALAAGVGPATVYRGFGTKEGVVLWDEYDPMLLSAVTLELREKSLLPAIQSALARSLDSVYRHDKRRILRRARLLFAEPSLAAAVAVQNGALRTALADLFLSESAVQSPFDAQIAAAAVVATLEAAIEIWVREDGKTPMAKVITSAFDSLARIVTTSTPDRQPLKAG